MTVESSLLHSDSEDIFAQAIERVEAGEPVDAVLATVPVALHAELREILLLVTATHHLQRAPVPQPAAPRRAARKAAFLQAAAQMQAEMVAEEQARVAAQRAQSRLRISTWFQNFWSELQMGFAAPNLRLAPLLIILAVVWLGAFGFYNVTQAAEIGDAAYSWRAWAEYQEFKLSSVEARGRIYKTQAEKLIDDLTKSAAKLRAEEKRTGRKAALPVTKLLAFEETVGNGLKFGPLTVMLEYQPDPNVDVYENTYMPLMPSTKQLVELTFQIIPTADENDEPPFITQGITITIPIEEMEMGPTPTDEPTATATPCTPTQPVGWVPSSILKGDTLSAIADRTGTTVAALQSANCVTDINQINSGAKLFAPALQQINTPTATLQESLKVTLTAISTTVVTPSVNITATMTVVPTDTVIITPTGKLITATLTAEATTTITTSVESTATVEMTPVPSVTVTATTEAIGTIEATLTAQATMTDTVEPAGTPIAPTVVATATSEAATTPASTLSITPAGAETSTTPAASASPTAAGTSTDTPIPTATWTPTPMPTSTEVISVDEATATAEVRQGRAPTPTSTPIPQNRSPLPGG